MESYPVRFRDPVHGFIHLSRNELRLVETRAFRRLRNIKQLALTYLVYPGAMHTRFEHSLGVMELATKAFDALCREKESRELLESTLKNIGMNIDRARMLLRATALLHDVGHLPFSHGGEGILAKGVKHEQVSIAIIRDDELSGLLEREFYSGIVDHIVLLLGKEKSPPPEILILQKLISGQFDADRMDYLSRDSLHCGVGYGHFDYLRLLETLRVKKSREGGLELCVERGGIHTLEAMVLARYWMFTQVYFHKTRRIYDIYLSRYLKAWYANQYEKLLGVLDHDDVTMMNEIFQDAKRASSGDRENYSKRIVERRHHHVVYETVNNADARDVRIAREVEGRLREKNPKIDFILDDGARQTLHNFYVKGDEKLGDEFPILDKISGHYPLLSDESNIFGNDKMRTFHVVRIYADIPKDQLPGLRTQADECRIESVRT